MKNIFEKKIQEILNDQEEYNRVFNEKLRVLNENFKIFNEYLQKTKLVEMLVKDIVDNTNGIAKKEKE